LTEVYRDHHFSVVQELQLGEDSNELEEYMLKLQEDYALKLIKDEIKIHLVNIVWYLLETDSRSGGGNGGLGDLTGTFTLGRTDDLCGSSKTTSTSSLGSTFGSAAYQNMNKITLGYCKSYWWVSIVLIFCSLLMLLSSFPSVHRGHQDWKSWEEEERYQEVEEQKTLKVLKKTKIHEPQCYVQQKIPVQGH
jgi:hypothetical protein